jgi:hypothetical protein
VGSRAVGYVAAPEPSSTRRWGPKLLDMSPHALLLVLAVRAADLAPDVAVVRAIVLGLLPIHGGTRFVGYRQWPPGPPRER